MRCVCCPQDRHKALLAVHLFKASLASDMAKMQEDFKGGTNMHFQKGNELQGRVC